MYHIQHLFDKVEQNIAICTCLWRAEGWGLVHPFDRYYFFFSCLNHSMTAQGCDLPFFARTCMVTIMHERDIICSKKAVLSFDAFFSFLSIGRESTTWPANNCLQIIMVCSCVVPYKRVLLHTIFCSCVIGTTFSREKWQIASLSC